MRLTVSAPRDFFVIVQPSDSLQSFSLEGLQIPVNFHRTVYTSSLVFIYSRLWSRCLNMIFACYLTGAVQAQPTALTSSGHFSVQLLFVIF